MSKMSEKIIGEICFAISASYTKWGPASRIPEIEEAKAFLDGISVNQVAESEIVSRGKVVLERALVALDGKFEGC